MKQKRFGFFNVNKKVGLALGGGGARGFVHIGAIKALLENGIDIDFIAGTSVGSIIGALFASGKSINEIIDIAKTFTLKEIKTSKILLVPNKSEALEQAIEKRIGNIDFKDLKIPFVAVSTDIKNGEEVYLSKGKVAKAVSSSCAVPGIFTPVEIDDHLLFDGGLLNNIPSNVARLNGCDVVIAIDINSTRGAGTQSVKHLDLIFSSLAVMMKGTSLKGYLNADVLIKPDTKRFKSTKIMGVDEMIEEGYKATIDKIGEIKDLLKIKPKRNFFKRNENRINKKNKRII